MSYRDSRAYMAAALFVAGNIVLPQLCHLVPQGGLVWLPIYFFTLVAAYKYGLTAGLLTAVASPVANSLLFGMPAAVMLPIILVKSVLLALAASFIASKVRGVALWAVDGKQKGVGCRCRMGLRVHACLPAGENGNGCFFVCHGQACTWLVGPLESPRSTKCIAQQGVPCMAPRLRRWRKGVMEFLKKWHQPLFRQPDHWSTFNQIGGMELCLKFY